MALVAEMNTATLTGVLNKIKSPNGYLRRTLFSRTQEVHTENIETHTITGGRVIAPFVRRDSEAIFVPGYTASAAAVSPPNIRIKRPFTPSELMYGRMPGQVIYVDQRSHRQALLAHIARDMDIMEDMITNAEEWLCAQVLQGQITYAVADQEVYRLTLPRDAANNITLTTFWDAADPTTVDLFAMIHSMKRIVSNGAGGSVNTAIMGVEAADAFLKLAANGSIKPLYRDQALTGTGSVNFGGRFNDDGVIYLGSLGGIDWYEYGRTATLNGVATNMIRPKYVEFFSTGNTASRVIYYGAIADMKALNGNRLAARRFSKAWEVEDPSALMQLAASRPLPYIGEPNAHVSAKVVSG